MNDHYIETIIKIRNDFKPHNIKAIDILTKIRTKVDNNIIIPPITIDKTKKLIANLNNSNAKGWDNITNNIIKKSLI